MTHLLTIVFGLFAIVNPIGAIPVFVSLTEKDTNKWKRTQALRGAIGMVMILMAFFLAGTYILSFFGISLNGIQIAGGLIILKSGYDLFSATKEKKGAKKTQSNGDDISFSPLAILSIQSQCL